MAEMKPIHREILKTLVIAIVIVIVLRAFVIESHDIISGSMEPSLIVGERIVVNKMVYNFQEPDRGDIIVFHPPYNPETLLIKRVIGLPGEIVEVTTNGVIIHQEDGNTLSLDEPYIMENSYRSYMGDVVPEDEYFVMGDNRNDSGDSRTGWTVPSDYIEGKAWLSVWPPSEWGLSPNYSFSDN